MTITIRFATDNAAFADDPIGEFNATVHTVTRRITNGETDGRIRDSNGNTIGTFKVTGKRK